MDPQTRDRVLGALGVLTRGRAARLRVEAELAGVVRHGTHNQKTHGNDRPGVDLKLDKLQLAGRIKLADGERLVASDSLEVDDADLTTAWIDGPSGRRLRLGIVPDAKTWRAENLGGTLDIDEAGVERIRTALPEIAKTGKREAAAMEARVQQALDDTGEVPFETDVIAADGVIDGGHWGDLAYQVELDDGEPIGWSLRIAVRPPGAPSDWSPYHDAKWHADLPPADVRKLVKLLGESP